MRQTRAVSCLEAAWRESCSSPFCVSNGWRPLLSAHTMDDAAGEQVETRPDPPPPRCDPSATGGDESKVPAVPSEADDTAAEWKADGAPDLKADDTPAESKADDTLAESKADGDASDMKADDDIAAESKADGVTPDLKADDSPPENEREHETRSVEPEDNTEGVDATEEEQLPSTPDAAVEAAAADASEAVEEGTGSSNTKVDDGLGHLSLDLRNIKQQFESPHEFVPSVSDRSALARSESLVKRLEKYQCAASGDRNGTVDTLESEEEENGEDSPVTKHGKAKEKVVVFEGLSSLKSQWETGKVSGHHQDEDREDVKEELAKLRKKMCLGRSESMRQVYQRAVGDASRSPVSGRSEAVTLEGHEVRATSVKEKFEAGALDRESEAEKIERLAREKQEELSVFSEAGIAHEAKNIFKQLDAEVAKQATSPTPTSLARSPSNRWSQPKPPPTEVVRSSDPVQDVEVETTELSERFKFFENYKEGSKERKRFEITPPREVREPSPDAPIRRDPDVVRAADPAEEIVVTDTARRMRERFRELEENAGKRELPQGPKPLKRITPPREYTVDDREESPEVVKCSYKTEEEVVVEADRTKSMRARFENWESAVARENRKNGTAEEDEEEYLPVADTAKNLRAKFEAIKDDAVRQEADRRKAKVNRFVEFPGTPPTDACNVCGKKLYPMERMEASGLRLHKNCFRCSHCSCHLRLENYTVSGGKLFCTPHFRQFFIAKGNYDEGFGREKWSRSTSPASREGTEDYTNTTNGRLGALDRPITA